MQRVAILAYEGAALFELSCAVELFALPRPEFSDWYKADVVGFGSGSVRSSTGLGLEVTSIRQLAGYDLLVIPGWPVDSVPPADLLEEIRLLHERGGIVLSFCSGSFLLAASGLLSGHKATTHWRYAERFRTRFPDVEYAEDVLYVYAGRIGCSAGSSAALDLGLAVIREQHGYRIANQVARRLVMGAHRSGGQSQFVETPVPRTPGPLAATLDWAVLNLPRGVTVTGMARQAHMSRRSFDRRFRATLGLSPNEWLTQQKLELARNLLEGTQFSVEQVAGMAGFDNAITLRHHFRRRMGISPARFRAQFNGAPPRPSVDSVPAAG